MECDGVHSLITISPQCSSVERPATAVNRDRINALRIRLNSCSGARHMIRPRKPPLFDLSHATEVKERYIRHGVAEMKQRNANLEASHPLPSSEAEALYVRGASFQVVVTVVLFLRRLRCQG